MKYSDVRPLIQDGDVALVSGNNVFSMLIRLFSAGLWSHVAVFFTEGDSLFVSEVKELDGHRITHASVWLDEKLTSGNHVKIGFAPPRVRGKAFVAEFIEQSRVKTPRYSVWMLPVVWLSNVTGLSLPGAGLVCSSYVQKCWNHSGRALVPRDFGRLCDQLYTIKEI